MRLIKIFIQMCLVLAFVQGTAQVAKAYNANMWGTGMSNAYPPCPYPQTTIADKVRKVSDRFENELNSLERKRRRAKSRLEGFENDKGYGECKRGVNTMIKLACGGGRLEGARAISDFEDHMRSSRYVSSIPSYEKTYRFLAKHLMPNYSGMDPNRMVAGAGEPQTITNADFEPRLVDPGKGDGTEDDNDPPGPATGQESGWANPNNGDKDDGSEGDGPPTYNPQPPDNDDVYVDINDVIKTSCVDKYGQDSGMIDPVLCDAGLDKVVNRNLSAEDRDAVANVYNDCRSCLAPTGSFRRGFYPQRFREIYDLQQEIAQLDNDVEIARAKMECAEVYLDGDDFDETGFKSCVRDADPYATTADYCIHCTEDDADKDEGSFLEKWGPGLAVAGVGLLGGIYAHRQAEKTRQGNWEAGYTSDDRAPWAIAQYGMGVAGMSINTLKASGAFGCSHNAGAMGAMNPQMGASYQFGGNPMYQMGGALGYPAGMMGGLNGQFGMGGGLFGNNPMAGPWGMNGGGAAGNLAAQQAMIQQQQAMLRYRIQQGQRDLATLNALARLDAQIAQIQAQRNQIFASNPTFGQGGTGMAGGAGYYGMGGGGFMGGLFGNIQANFGLNAWGGVGTGGIPNYPGTTPVQPPYTGGPAGPSYPYPNPGGTPTPSGPSTGSGTAVPSIGL